MKELTFKKEKKPSEPKIRGIETITVYNKGPLLKLGYVAFSVFIGKDKFLFDFCIN